MVSFEGGVRELNFRVLNFEWFLRGGFSIGAINSVVEICNRYYYCCFRSIIRIRLQPPNHFTASAHLPAPASVSSGLLPRCHHPLLRRSPITKALWEIRRAEMKFQVEKACLKIETQRLL